MNKKEILLRSLFNCKSFCHNSQLNIEIEFGDDIDKFPDDKLHDYLFLGFIYSSLQDIFDAVQEQFPNELPKDL